MSQFNKVMIFIDGSNVFKECRRLNIKIRYEKFINILGKNRNVMRSIYYSGKEVPPNPNQRRFFKMLRDNRIEVVTKSLKIRDETCPKCKQKYQKRIEKGVDAALATDLLWYAFQNSYDIAVLISGDSDFVPPVERVRLIGKQVDLWAFKGSLSPELKNIVDKINLIDNIIDQIA